MWASTPFWTRSLFITCTVIYITFWVTNLFVAILYCQPSIVVYQFQVWRLFTGLYVHPQLLTLLFAMMSHLPHAANAEREIGTVRYFCRFQMLGFFTLALYCLVGAVVGLDMPVMGLWPMLFVDLVIECMAVPEQVTNLCCLPI